MRSEENKEVRSTKLFVVCCLWFVVKKEVRSTRYEVSPEVSGLESDELSGKRKVESEKPGRQILLLPLGKG